MHACACVVFCMWIQCGEKCEQSIGFFGTRVTDSYKPPPGGVAAEGGAAQELCTLLMSPLQPHTARSSTYAFCWSIAPLFTQFQWLLLWQSWVAVADSVATNTHLLALFRKCVGLLCWALTCSFLLIDCGIQNVFIFVSFKKKVRSEWICVS